MAPTLRSRPASPRWRPAARLHHSATSAGRGASASASGRSMSAPTPRVGIRRERSRPRCCGCWRCAPPCPSAASAPVRAGTTRPAAPARRPAAPTRPSRPMARMTIVTSTSTSVMPRWERDRMRVTVFHFPAGPFTPSLLSVRLPSLACAAGRRELDREARRRPVIECDREVVVARRPPAAARSRGRPSSANVAIRHEVLLLPRRDLHHRGLRRASDCPRMTYCR